MKKLFLLSSLFFFCISAFAQLPKINWWFDTDDASFGQSIAADIDNDGKLELIFGCYRNDSMVYALNAEDGSLLWKYNTGAGSSEGCNDVAPIVFDVNGDDTLDVIVPSSCNPTTFCFHGASGKVIWSSPTRGSDSPPTIADVDNDGKMELLHGEFGGYVICLNIEDGSKAWEIPVDLNSWIQTAPTIVDIDGDSYPDFVVATWNAVNKDSNKVYAYRGHDQKLLWKHSLSNFVYHGTAVADLDQDDKPELVIGDYSGKVTALNAEDGSLYWEYQCPQYFYAASPVSIADIDHDGRCEVLFSAWYKVYALSFDGKVKWEYDIPNYGSCFRGVALSDIDNDSKPDVIFGSSLGNLYSLKGTDGSLIWELDLEAHYGDTFTIDHASVISDFDKDGILDAFVVGGFTEYPKFEVNYGRAYCISVGKGAGPDWLMFQYDIQRQSSLCAATSGIESLQVSNEINVYPNPSAGDFHILVNDRMKANYTVTVYSVNAKKIVESEFKDVKGEIAISLPSLTIQDGFYIVQILSDSEIKTFKLLISN